MKQIILRIFYLGFILCGLFGPVLSNLGPVLAQREGSRVVYLLTFQGAVTPVLDQYIADQIAEAALNNGEAIILQLDTPGGSVEITKSITQKMLASPVPIVVYVAPSGAHAGSAGTFLTLAGHVAAMAPGSSIGAASPVGAAGEDVGETMAAKITNILSADIENLAERRGAAAVEWAIAAVQEAAAATANQALELGVIDLIATDVADLLTQLDGFTVTIQGEPHQLQTAQASIATRDLSPLQEFLNFIANPTIAALLLTLGSAGLLAELWNPGTWIPGIAGAICLLLGLYALGQLDANFAGVALMAVAVALFIAEAFTPTFGALIAAGLVAFLLGAALLFDAPGIETPWGAMVALALFLAAFTFYASAKGLAIQRKPPITGGEALIGQYAHVKQPFAAGEKGSVFIAGEWWNAHLENGAVQPGDEVEILGRTGYTLLVKRKA